MQITSGIYKIVNRINSKYYIGSSSNIFRRWNNHKALLRRNHHPNSHLQYAWNKYGENALEMEILEICPKQFLLEQEQIHLDKCKLNRTAVYNTTFIAGGGNLTQGKLRIFKDGRRKMIAPEMVNAFLEDGWKHGTGPMSDKTKQKIGNANRGKKKPPFSREHRRKLGEASRGRTHIVSTEHREKMRTIMTGRKHRPESILKMGLKGERHPFYGKHHSNSTKEKLSKALTGKFLGQNNPRFDGTVYTFRNINTAELVVSTRYDLYQKYNIDKSNINKLLKGRIKNCGGWELCQISP